MTRYAGLPLHGGQLRRIAERFGLPASGLLDFSANINPGGPSPAVVEALKLAIADAAVLSQYPDLEENELRLAISASIGVAPSSVLVANGFVPLLDAALRALPIRRCLLPVPAFGEYRQALERAGVQVTPLRLDPETDFNYQASGVLAALAAGDHDSILLANPQNPSGVLWRRADLLALIEHAEALNVRVLVDEAFIDYAPADSITNQIARFQGLIVFRSVTKFHGMPGLRIAYAVASDAACEEIRRAIAPWPITTLAEIAVRAALADRAYAADTLRVNRENREQLALQLRSLGIESYRAAGNFLLVRFTGAEEAERIWERLIVRHKIVLRHCGNFEGLGSNHLRCAVRSSEDNARLMGALVQELGIP